MASRPLDRTSIAFLKGFEGCKLYPYDDKDGWLPAARLRWDAGAWRRADGRLCLRFPTIGWGKRIWPNERPETYGMAIGSDGACSITQAQADTLLARTLVDFVAAVDRECVDKADLSRVPSDHERGAMVAAAYNLGTGGFARSGIPEAWRTRQDPRDAWLDPRLATSQGVHDVGLAGRRAKEYAFYMTPMPDKISAATRAQVLADVDLLSRDLVADIVLGRSG